MKWKNAQVDGPPRDNEQTLIAVNGVYYIASYNEETRCFKVFDKIAGFFYIDRQTIYWTEFDNAPGVR